MRRREAGSRGVLAKAARVIAAAALVVTTLVAVASRAPAVSIQPYTPFFHADTNGQIVLVGNNLESCPSTTPGCTDPRNGIGPNVNNNNWNMTFVNQDPSVAGNSAFFSSSSADLTIPAGATVLYAQLSWGARTAAGVNGSKAPPGPVGQMSLRLPGSSTYQAITAANVYGNDPSVSSGMYHTFADVTSLVTQAGSGTYWGANVRAATGQDRYAGWSLVVVLADPAQPLRDLTVFNGFAIVDSPTGQTIPLSGFLAPQFGTVNASVGAVAYEGDLGLTGDQMKFNGVPLNDKVVPVNNFFDSGNSVLGVLNAARSPADLNMLGFDVKSVSADGILPNGATSATVNLTTSNDTYAPGVVTTSINLFSPVFPPQSKTVTDVTPSQPVGAGVGDTLEYTIDLPNTGGDGAANSVISDALPPDVTYVAGSLRYATGTANGPLGPFTNRTDAPGDDNGEFLAGTPPGGNGTVRVRAGVGANATTGGVIRPNDRVVVKFRVTVNASAAGTTISNTDQLNYDLATLGTPITRVGLPAAIAVAPRADLAITKSAAPSPLAPGQNATYTLTVVNNGPNAASNVVATDALPVSLTFVSATPSTGGPCSVGASLVSCPLGTLASGQTATITVVAHLAANATGISSVNDVASVTSSTDDPIASNNVASITTPVRRTADLAAAIAVTAGSPATPGGSVALTLTATNLGPSDAADATLTADLGPLTKVAFSGPPPAGCTIVGTVVTCTRAPLAAGASFAVTLTAVVDPGQTGASIPLSDRVTTSTFDPNSANDVATTSLPLTAPSADIVVTKTAASGTAIAGGPFSYTLTIRNNGPSSANAVTLTDPLPSQVTFVDATPSRGTCQAGPPVTCSFGTFAPGGTATVVISVTVPANAPTGPFSNTAAGASTTPDPNSGNNSATTTATVAANVDVAITKTASPARATPGAPMTFTLSATNNGPSLARAASITDLLPAPLVFNSVTNANGTCTAPAPGTVGGTITCGVGDIPPDGSTRSVTVNVTVPSSFTTPVTNTATVTSQGTDLNPANNTAAYEVSASPVADLSVAKAVTSPAPPDPLVAGTPVTWHLTVTNDGPSDATGVQVTDPIPSTFITGVTASFGSPATLCAVAGTTVTCNIGALASGQSVVVTVSGTVPAAAPNNSTLINTATVTSTTPDPTASNNSDTTVSTIVTRADLGITKTASSPTVDAGGTVTFTFTVTNNGPSVAQTPSGVDVLPAGVSIVPGSAVIPSGWSCSLAGRGVSCTDANDLGVGQSATLQVALKADTDIPAGTVLGDTATVSTPTVDGNPANDVATASVTVTVHADLRVSKAVTTSPVVAGAPATFTITVNNDGPSDATLVTVSDVLPFPAASATDISPSQGTCGPSLSAVTCDLGVLPAGAAATITIVVTVPTNATGSLSNTATATSATPDPNSANNSATASAPITNLADVRIVKSASATSIAAGAVVDYTLTVTNTGPSDAVGVIATDAIGAGFTPEIANSSPACTVSASTFTCAAGTLVPGATVSFVIEVRADPALAPGSYDNTATASATTTDPNPANNTSTVSIAVERVADVSLVKNADVTIPAAGTQFTYTLSAANGGPSNATTVVVTDTLPAGLTFVSSPDPCTANGQLVTCQTPLLAPGSRIDFQVTVALAPSAPPGLLANAATVKADGTDPNLANNAGTFSVTVQQVADLSIQKQVISGAVVAGQPVTYQITVTNAGPSDSAGTVVLDSLADATLESGTAPGGPCTVGSDGSVTCPVGSIPVGTTATFTLTFAVDAGASGTLSNTATLTSTSSDPVADNNTATATSPINTDADVSVTNQAGAAEFVAGGPVSWTMTVHNAGPSDAQSVTIDDPLDPAVTSVTISSSPAGLCTGFPCNIGTLAVGDTVTISIQGTLSPSYTAPTLSKTGLASSPTPDPNRNNNEAVATTPVVTSADLQVAKTGPEQVAAGRAITWTVTVHNAGPSDPQSVALADPVPSLVSAVSATASQGSCTVASGDVTCTVGTLAADATATVTISGTVAPGAPLGPLTNTATATSTTNLTGDNTASFTTQITEVADLSVTKQFATTPVVPGQPLAWHMAVANAGPSDATGVVLTDPVPAGVSVSTVTPASLGCTVAANEVTCPLGTVASGTSVMVDVTGALSPSFTGSTLSNTATVEAATIDPTAADNTATASTPVTPEVALALTKTASQAAIEQGGDGSFTITARNAGPSDATPLVITDPLPIGMTALRAKVAGGTCALTNAARTVTCSVAALAPGATASATVDVHVAANAPTGPMTNTASAAAGNVPSNAVVTAHATVTIDPAPAVNPEGEPATTAALPSTETSPGTGSLPFTGGSAGQLVAVAALLGAAGMAARKRRR